MLFIVLGISLKYSDCYKVERSRYPPYHVVVGDFLCIYTLTAVVMYENHPFVVVVSVSGEHSLSSRRIL